MTTLLPPGLPSSAPISSTVKKKRVLLVDCSQTKRELRAEVMNRPGMDVDCAANIAEARSRWRAALYDLVLMNMEKGFGYRDRFCHEICTAAPPQRLAFLVGQRENLAHSPHADEESPMENGNERIGGDSKVAFPADRGDLAQHWAILEASQRISAVRTASLARTRAMRTLTAAARDSEGPLSKRTATPNSLNDLLREELQ